MIAVDTNILVAAHRADAEFHPSAADAIRGLAEGSTAWSIPWPCLHEFIAVVTHPRIFRQPSTVEQALAQIDAWLGSPTLRLIGEGPRHLESLRQLLASGVVGPKVHDARVAAICLQHGARELWSVDRDFSRFPELKTRNPLTRNA